MRSVFFAVLLLGLGLAGYAVYMARGYVNAYRVALDQERAARSEVVALSDVYVATRPLRYGERLKAEDVRLIRWPADAVPAGAFQDEASLFPAGGEAPRSVLRAMEKDEPVLAVKLTGPGEDAGVSTRLSEGMRAFAVRVDVASGVSGFLRPGDRVDVYWSGRAGSDAAEMTKLIETGVRLVAVDQSADEDHSNPVVARTVTVEVTPRQVATLAQAQNTGRLSLALVGAADNSTAASVEIDQRELLGIKERKIAAEPQVEVCTIRNRRGAEVVEIPIPCTN